MLGTLGLRLLVEVEILQYAVECSLPHVAAEVVAVLATVLHEMSFHRLLI